MRVSDLAIDKETRGISRGAIRWNTRSSLLICPSNRGDRPFLEVPDDQDVQCWL